MADEATVTKLFVNADWTEQTLPVSVEFDGETIYLQWGENAFNDVFAASAVAKELSGKVNIDITGELVNTNGALNFVASGDTKLATGWYDSDADITFTGTGTVQAKYFLRGNPEEAGSSSPKGANETITISNGATIKIENSTGEGQYNIDGNTVNVYGKLNVDMIRMSEHGGGTVNVYSGGLFAYDYISNSGCQDATSSPVINVMGDGQAFGEKQLEFTEVSGLNKAFGSSSYANSFTVNVKDYGVAYVSRNDGNLALYSNQQINLNNGKLSFSAASSSIDLSGASKLTMTGKSDLDVATLTVNSGSVSVSWDSKLTYTTAITVSDSASFVIDFAGFDASALTAGETFTIIDGGTTGTITGTISAINTDALSAAGYGLSADGNSVSLAQINTSLDALVINTDWAGLANGDTVAVGSVIYKIGLNAFADFDLALDAAKAAELESVTIVNGGDSPYEFVADQDPVWSYVERGSNVLFAYTNQDSYLTTGTPFYTIDASGFTGGLTLVGDFAAKNYTTWDPEDPAFADLGFTTNESKPYAIWENTWNPGCGTGTNIEIKGNVTIADDSSLTVIGANSTLKVTDGSVNVSGTGELKTSNFGADGQSSVLNLEITDDTNPAAGLYTLKKLVNPAAGTLESEFYGTPTVNISVADGVEIDGIYKVFAFDDSTSIGKVAHLDSVNWVLDETLTAKGYNVMVAPDGVYLATLTDVDMSTLAYDTAFADAKFGDTVICDGKEFLYGINAFATYSALENGIRGAAGDGSQKITVIMNSDASNSSCNIGNGYKVNVEFVASQEAMANGVELSFPGNGNNVTANNSSIITIGKGVTISQSPTVEQTNLNWRYISELHIYGTYRWNPVGNRYGAANLNNVDITVYDGGKYEWLTGTCWTTFKTLTVHGNGTAFQFDTDGNPIYGWNVYRGTDTFSQVTGQKLTIDNYGAVRMDQLNNIKEIYIEDGRLDTVTAKSTGFIKSFTTLSVTGESVVNTRGITVDEGATATISATSKINFYQTINGAGTITVDFDGFSAPVGGNIVMIADGTSGATITAKVEAAENTPAGWGVAATGNDIFAYDTSVFSTDTIYVNSTWTGEGYTFGSAFVSEGTTYYYGINAFANLADAAAGADRIQDTVTIINVETDSEGVEVVGTIANNATLNFAGMNNVQLSGTYTGTNFKVSGGLTVGADTILKSTTGTVTLNGGASVTMAEGGEFSAVNVTINNGAALDLADGTYGITNALTVNAGGSATISGGTVTALKGITVNGDTKNNIVGAFTVGENVDLSIIGSITAKGDVILESGSSLTLTGNNTDITVSNLGKVTVAYDSDLILKRNFTTNDQLYIDCTGFDESKLTADELAIGYAIIVDGRNMTGTFTGGFNTVGTDDLIAAGWAAQADGKNVFVYDTSIYTTDIYVNSAWAGIGSMELVEEGSIYRMNVNAYADYASAVKFGATNVISLSQLTGDIEYKTLSMSFGEELVEAVNAGSVTLDSIDAAGKTVVADKLILSEEGNQTYSTIDTMILGDGENGDAVLSVDAGDVLNINKLVVKEAAQLNGDVFFTGRGASITIEDGATLTMTLDQLFAIEGVEITGAANSVIISDLGTKKLTATQISNLQDMYGDIIAGLGAADFVLDKMGDLSALLDENGKSIYTGDVSGTNSSDKLVVDEGSVADYSGVDYNMRGGKNAVTVNSDADFTIGNLKNVSTVDVKAGGKDSVTKATFYEITTAAGSTAVKVGNNVEFTAAGIGLGDLGGSTTVSFGNNVNAVITGTDDAYGYIYGVKSVTVGNDSVLNVKGGDVKSYDDVPAATLKVGNGSTLDLEDVDYDEIGSINGIETVTFGNGATANVQSISGAKNITFGKESILSAKGDIEGTALKIGDGSTVIAGDVDMSTVTLGKNVFTEIGDLDDVKTLTLGTGNTFSADSIDGTVDNGSIKAGDGSTVEIEGSVNMRGGKNAITTGKGSNWMIGGDVKNVNTLMATAAGNWVWSEDKTTYTMQQTSVSIDGDFIAAEGATALTFGNYSAVNIGGGILESDLGSAIKITVGSNAFVNVNEFDVITGLNNLTLANGVDYKTFTVVDGKAVADFEKTYGQTVFYAGKVTGTDGNDTIKVGNQANLDLGNVFLGDGNDTINIGKDSYFQANVLDLGDGKNTVVIGADSYMTTGNISGVNKLTSSGTLFTGDILGTDEADTVTLNGIADVDSIDLGGNVKDKLVIGNGANVVINGSVEGIDTLTIGKEATVSATESTIIDLVELGNAKGSKIDATASFIALDDAAGDITSAAAYDADFNALLGLNDDFADCFTLGSGTDLTGWEISGEGIKVTVFKQTVDGWDGGTVIEDAVGEGAVADGKFDLTDFTAEGVTGVKVAVSLDPEEGEAVVSTKYSVTKLA